DQDDGEVRVRSERFVRFFRSVSGRGETIRAEADPRQEGHEGDVVEDPRVADVARRPNDHASNVLDFCQAPNSRTAGAKESERGCERSSKEAPSPTRDARAARASPARRPRPCRRTAAAP